MDNQTRVARLTELKSMLKNHDQLFAAPGCSFDIRVWRREGNGSTCGTAACALGSAAMHQPFIEQGLKMNVNSYNGTYNGQRGHPDFNNNSGYRAGAEFFGITHKESQFLFDPAAYENQYGNLAKMLCGKKISHSQVTAETVEKRVDALLAHYKENGGEKDLETAIREAVVAKKAADEEATASS